jgi:hypothetical protein
MMEEGRGVKGGSWIVDCGAKMADQSQRIHDLQSTIHDPSFTPTGDWVYGMGPMDRTNKMIIKLVVLLVSVAVAMVYLKNVAKQRAEAAEKSRLEQQAKPNPNLLMSGSKSMVTTKFIEIDQKDVEQVPVSPENLATSSKSGPAITAEELKRLMEEREKQQGEAPRPEEKQQPER